MRLTRTGSDPAALSRLGQYRLLAMLLAPGDAVSPALRSRVSDPDLDWQSLCYTASQQLVTPALAGSLARRGLLGCLPAEARDYLEAVRYLNQERNRQFQGELERVAARLNGLGIEPLLLKGGIALLADQYPGAGDRVLGDLDFIVPASQFEAVYAALEEIGYATGPIPAWQDQSLHHHGWPLFHPTLPVKLEVHRRILLNERDSDRLMAQVCRETVMLPGNGSRVQIPDPASRLLHNFVHAQINDRLHAMQRICLRQLLEFVSLRAYFGNRLDWPALWQRVPARQQRAFAHYLLVGEELFGQAWPPELPRPRDGRRALLLWRLALESPGWQRVFNRYAQLLTVNTLPKRLARLPRKLLSPGWIGYKVGELKKGKPL